MKNLKQIIIIFICIFCIINDGAYYNQTSHSIKIKNEIESESNSSQEDIIHEPTIIDKTPIINDKIKQLLKKYSQLNDIIIAANIKIPNKNKFIPQGIAIVKENILITGYYDSKKNSKCYVINNLGEVINIVELDTNSHVGAISYDEANDLIWIPDNGGRLNAYNSIDFFEKSKVKAIYKFNKISSGLVDFQNSQKKLIAYLYIDKNNLYIGNFFIDKECIIKKYQITTNNNKINLKYINSFKVPPRTQSIMFIEKNNKTYMFLSKSYRRRNSSYIYVYEYNEKIKNYTNKELVKIKAPPMLEQINFQDNNIYFLFESTATKYKNCPEKIKHILIGDINKIFNKINIIS